MSCLCYTGAAGDEPWASKTSVLAALQEAGPMRAKRPYAEHDAEDPIRGMQLGDEEDPMLHIIKENKAKKAKKEKKEKREKKVKDKEKSRDKVIILKEHADIFMWEVVESPVWTSCGQQANQVFGILSLREASERDTSGSLWHVRR